jgi:choline dehydrogenase-like flavoprotein
LNQWHELYARPAEDYDRWAVLTSDQAWRWDQVLPAFRAAKTTTAEQAPSTVAGGARRVEREHLSWAILDTFRTVAAENGIPAIDDVNGGNKPGRACFEVNQRRCIRLNTAKAFLRPASTRLNLTIMTGRHVERLLIENGALGKTWAGVQFTGGGRVLLPERAKKPYWRMQSGPISMAPSQLGAFACSDSSQARPNLEYRVQPLSLDRFGDPLHDFPAFTGSICNLRPTSPGHARIASSDPCLPPRITTNYLSTPGDRQVAAAALSLTRRIMARRRWPDTGRKNSNRGCTTVPRTSWP